MLQNESKYLEFFFFFEVITIFAVMNLILCQGLFTSTSRRMGALLQFHFLPRRQICVSNCLRRNESMRTENDNVLADKKAPERTYLEEILTQKEEGPKTKGQRVKHAAATTFYITFGLASVASLGFLVFYIFKEFFSFGTPQGLYRDAVRRLKENERCRELFGSKMLTFGEESGRGRRRHIASYKYAKDDQERLRIMFHVKGDKQIGRVHAEIARGENGWDYRYLLVETEGYPKNSIVIIDQR